MKKISSKKLSLRKTNLRALGAVDLFRARGGVDNTDGCGTQSGTGWETAKCNTNQVLTSLCITWDPLRSLLCSWGGYGCAK